jgi:hypothetical protein
MNRINKKLIEVWGLFLFLGMAFCACPQIVVAQNVQMVKVQGVGQGKTEAEAIKDAIVQAVAQVSGQKLQSNESARESSVESSTEKGRYAAEYQRKTDTSVRGVARSYRVISVGSEGTSGLYKALVEVDVPKFQQSNQLDRFKVAVVARKMSTVPAEFDENFLNAMVEAASEVIVKTHKFAVLDRSENESESMPGFLPTFWS